MSIFMFFKEMPKIKKRRNVGLVNLRNFKGFRRESSEGEIAQTDQISELRDIPIEIRPDSPLDTGFLLPNNESILSFETSNIQHISNINENSNNSGSFKDFDTSNYLNFTHDIELDNSDENLNNSERENFLENLNNAEHEKYCRTS